MPLPSCWAGGAELPYYVVILEAVAGAQIPQDLRQSHLNYIASMKEKGILLVSGRFTDGSGGLFIISAEGLQEALRIASSDPYVVSGVRRPQVKEWERVY
jgi:uncharacterized protein YciI